MSAAPGIEREAEIELNVDLELCEPLPVDVETLDRHSDLVADALDEDLVGLALGLVISLGTNDSTIGLRFDVLADTDAEALEKIAEVTRVVERKTGLGLRVVRSEIETIDLEARAADLARLRGSDQIAAA